MPKAYTSESVGEGMTVGNKKWGLPPLDAPVRRIILRRGCGAASRNRSVETGIESFRDKLRSDKARAAQCSESTGHPQNTIPQP